MGAGVPPPLAFRPVMDRTFVICKPDAVERGLVGEIVSRFERKGLKLVAMDLRHVDRDTAAKHYAEHEGKGFYNDLLDFITRSPVVALVLEGPEDTWKVVRTMMGTTNPRDHDGVFYDMKNWVARNRPSGVDHATAPGARAGRRWRSTARSSARRRGSPPGSCRGSAGSGAMAKGPCPSSARSSRT